MKKQTCKRKQQTPQKKKKRILRTVRQFTERHPAFTEPSLRWLIFNEGTNGFKGAFPKIGGKRVVDERVFFECIDANNSEAA